MNRLCSVFMLTLIAGGARAGDAGRPAPLPEETIVSDSLRFVGEVVGVLPSGQPMRKTAIARGRTFLWQGQLGRRVATPESEPQASAVEVDVDEMSLEELAQNLRGLALFNGHQFLEAEPAYDLARLVKLQRELERGGASPEELDQLLPGVAGSQGQAPRTARPDLEEPGTKGGLPSPHSVHGVDDRVVSGNTVYPYRTQVVFDNTGSTVTINSAQGSGTLIGPSTAMSVAHVFWDEVNGTWEADFAWAAGFDNQDADPSPWGDWYRCYWVTIPTGYTVFPNSGTYDYAVLNFNVGCNSVDNGVNSDRPGSTVGWLGHYTASDGDIESRLGFVRGYPGLGTCGNPGQPCAVRVWGDFSSASENDATGIEIRHQADTSGGQSGSGFYHYADPGCAGCGNGAYLVGMHRAGAMNYNVARKFDGTVLAFMRAHSIDF